MVLKPLVLFILAFAWNVAWAKTEPALKFRSYVKIEDGERIHLSQLLSIRPQKEMADLLSQIELGSAPALGERRIFTNKAIAQALRSHPKLKNVKVVIPSQIVVENRGYELNKETIENELLSRWTSICNDCDLKLKSLRLPVLPPDMKNRAWKLDVDSRLPKGPFNVKLLVQTEQDRPALYWVAGELMVRRLVPVAKRSLSLGQRLTSEDFAWEWRDVTQAADGFPDENSIVGQKIRLPVQVGDILFSGRLEREKAVYRGEAVRARTGDSNWEISLDAIAEQDGFIGDTVNVRNRQTNKILSAEVIARGEVRVR